MPRKHLIRTDSHPYHITLRSNNQEWFDLTMNTVWDICLNAFSKAYHKHPVDLQAFILMSNHYHMLVWTPKFNLDLFMFEFNRNIGNGIRLKTNRINRIFGDRYKLSLVDNPQYYSIVIKYIYQNPIRAGLVTNCENYCYSTLFYMINSLPFVIPLINPISKCDNEILKWINDRYSEEENSSLKMAISKRKFIPPRSKSSRRKLLLI